MKLEREERAEPSRKTKDRGIVDSGGSDDNFFEARGGGSPSAFFTQPGHSSPEYPNGVDVEGSEVGVRGTCNFARPSPGNGCGVEGISKFFHGVRGRTESRSPNDAGVFGTTSDSSPAAGVSGRASTSGPGVKGTSTSGPGVKGASTSGPGVEGESDNLRGSYGVLGKGPRAGVRGESSLNGIEGTSSGLGRGGVFKSEKWSAQIGLDAPVVDRGNFTAPIGITPVAPELPANGNAGDLIAVIPTPDGPGDELKVATLWFCERSAFPGAPPSWRQLTLGDTVEGTAEPPPPKG